MECEESARHTHLTARLKSELDRLAALTTLAQRVQWGAASQQTREGTFAVNALLVALTEAQRDTLAAVTAWQTHRQVALSPVDQPASGTQTAPADNADWPPTSVPPASISPRLRFARWLYEQGRLSD